MERLTGVNELKLADDIQTHFREFVLQETQKLGEGGAQMVMSLPTGGREPADLVGKRSPNVLGNVLAQVAHRWDYPGEYDFSFAKLMLQPWMNKHG